MPNLHTDKDCCGCSACASVCQHNAITMAPDSIGFKYPEINPSLCVDCKLCEKVCSFNNDYKTPQNFSQPIPYGVRMKDIEEVMKSRSGGAFVAFSDFILDKGGIIYGAGFKDHLVVAHKRAITKEERDEFRGSKYVQSDLDGIFRQVKDDLSNGFWVMFSGTACQVSGLQSFLPDKLKQKLITVDIVCHGVPAPKIWEDYLKYVEEKEKMDVVSVDFRDKKNFGWKAHKESLTLQNLKTGEEKTISTDIFTFLFYQHIMLRPSCAECKYCNVRRPADLTLADFWGWEKTGSCINDDNKGLSLVLVNTPAGKKIFENVKHRFDIINPKLEDCVQPNLKSPTKPDIRYKNFQSDYENKGFQYILQKYGNVSTSYKIKNIASRLKRRFLKVIKKMSNPSN